MGRGAGKTLAGGQRSIQRGQAAAGVQQVGLLGDFPEQGVALLAAGEKSDRTRKGSVKPLEAAATPSDWTKQIAAGSYLSWLSFPMVLLFRRAILHL